MSAHHAARRQPALSGGAGHAESGGARQLLLYGGPTLSPVPGEQCCRGHREHLAQPAPGDQPGQCRKPQPVGRLVADPADLAAQHRVLVLEHQQFGILGRLTPGQHHQTGEQTACEQVDHREDHSAMIPADKTAQARARSSNRAPQHVHLTTPASRLRSLSARRPPAPRAGHNADAGQGAFAGCPRR